MMTDKNRILKGAAVTCLLLLFSVNASGAPLWKAAVNAQFKLFGKILIADEKGSRWDDSLPQGWSWTTATQKPGRYYSDLGQMEADHIGNRVVFSISRWNFINSAVQEGFSEEAVMEKIHQLRKLPEIIFKEDAKFSEAREEFQNMGRAEATPLLTLHRQTDFSISVSGILVVQTTADKLMKLFVENYSTSAYIAILPVTDTGGSDPDKVLNMVRIIEFPWRADLDGDGLVDIEWKPISHIESSQFIAPKGTKIGVVKTFR